MIYQNQDFSVPLKVGGYKPKKFFSLDFHSEKVLTALVNLTEKVFITNL